MVQSFTPFEASKVCQFSEMKFADFSLQTTRYVAMKFLPNFKLDMRGGRNHK